jgi:hypothetical protein
MAFELRNLPNRIADDLQIIAPTRNSCQKVNSYRIDFSLNAMTFMTVENWSSLDLQTF